jgi:hypothetical protein
MERKVCFLEKINVTEEIPCAIEFQAFRGNNDEFIIKELVILDLLTGVNYSFMFKPPFAFRKLNSKAKTTNRWLTKNFHCISWNEGFTSYKKIDSIMYHFCKEYTTIYTRGLEKRNWIKMYTENSVIDVMIEKYFTFDYDKNCNLAMNKKHSDSQCALKNAFKIVEFFNCGGENRTYKYEDTSPTWHQYHSRRSRENNNYSNELSTVLTKSS